LIASTSREAAADRKPERDGAGSTQQRADSETGRPLDTKPEKKPGDKKRPEKKPEKPREAVRQRT
jgi:hypothetical protein